MIGNNDYLLLSRYDQALIGAPSIVRLFHYAYIPDVDRLRYTFQATLERFPRLATKIVNTGEGFRLAPLSLLPSVTLRGPLEWTLDQFSSEQLPQFIDNLETLPGRPVLIASLTPVSRGAVLAISMSHSVGDGSSLNQFQKCWGELFAEARSHFTARATVDPVVGLEAKHSVCGQHSLGAEAIHRLNYLRQMKRNLRVMKLDTRFLDVLRKSLSTSDLVPTLNEALTAFLVHRYGQQLLDCAQGIRLRMPVDVRGIDARIGPSFVGNGFLEAVMPLDRPEDDKAAARRTIRLIRTAVKQVRDPGYVASSIKSADGHAYLDQSELPPFEPKTDLVSTNLSQLTFNRMDFGGGPPAGYRCMLPAPAGILIGPAAEGVQVHFASERDDLRIGESERPDIWDGGDVAVAGTERSASAT
jgi:hypothetical protein